MKFLHRKHGILPLVLAVFLLLSVAAPVLADKSTRLPREGFESNEKHKGEELVVELREGESIARINAQYGTSLVKKMPGTQVYLLGAPANGASEQMAKILSDDKAVISAEPNEGFKGVDAQQFSIAFDGKLPFSEGVGQSETLYKEQWAVYKTRLPEAQAIAAGRGVTIAIIDTGAGMSHPALLGKFTVARYDFVDGDADPSDLPNGVDDDGDGLADEATGHGTFVSGIVALVAPEASLMPLRVLNSDGWGTIYDVAAAIHYAVDNGAGVLNVSLGVNRSSRVIEKAIDYAYAKGAVVVAPVGNTSADYRIGSILYPARYPKALAVAASDSDDLKASFSNFGRETDLSAPGAAIYSTYWNGGYAWWSGTSMAAAFVSGGAALVRSLHPDWTRDGIASRLASTAANIDGLNDHQYRNKLGAGRIDYYSAVK